MSVVLAILISSVAADPTELDWTAVTYPGVRPELVAQKVAACGFDDVLPKFDETLQEDIIEVRNTAATAEQLRCVAQTSLMFSYYVIFPNSVDQNYQPLYWRMAAERDTAKAKAWLDKRGLLSRVPQFDPKNSDSTAFAHSLEALCGPKASGALKPLQGIATFNEGVLSDRKLDDDTFWCLINAAQASGYRIGFIGNEAYPPPKP